jgi:hypothetical protein
MADLLMVNRRMPGSTQAGSFQVVNDTLGRAERMDEQVFHEPRQLYEKVILRSWFYCQQLNRGLYRFYIRLMQCVRGKTSKNADYP